jgi:hypothetical protein
MELDATWAENAFGAADVGDVRRTARRVPLATVLGAQPRASLPDAPDDPAMRKAASRFCANDDVRTAAMRERHVPSTCQRIHGGGLVLAVQATPSLDWTHHPATTGLGPLAAPSPQGLWAHTPRARTPEGVPLGLLPQQVWARDPETRRPGDHTARSIDEKESRTWLTRVAARQTARAACPNTQFVRVGDREADGSDRFLRDRAAGVDVLVRAAQDRKAETEER